MNYRDLVLGDSPVAYWRLGEASGDALDSAGSHPGDVDSSFTRDVTGLLTLDDDGAVEGDGGGVIFVPHASDIAFTGPYTLELWFKPTAEEVEQTFFWKMSGDVTAGYALLANEDGTVSWLHGTGAFPVAPASTNTLEADTVYHLVAVYNGSTMRLLVNGQEWVNLSWNTNPAATTEPLTLGPLIGVLDEVALYDYALSDAQILTHYRFGLRSRETRTATTSAALSQLATRAAGLSAALSETHRRTATPVTAALSATETATAPIRAVLLDHLERRTELGAALLLPHTHTLAASAALRAVPTRTAALSADLRRTLDRTAAIRAVLLSTETRSAAASAALQGALVRSGALSAALVAQAERSAAASAALLATQLRDGTLSAALQATETRTATPVTAALLGRLERRAPASTALLASFERTATTQAVLEGTFTRAAAASAVLVWERSALLTAALLATETRTAGLAAVLAGSAVRLAALSAVLIPETRPAQLVLSEHAVAAVRLAEHSARVTLADSSP